MSNILSSDAEKFKEEFEQCQKKVRAARENEENDTLTSDLETLTLKEEGEKATTDTTTNTTTNVTNATTNVDPE